ncbi:hypothetical protein L6R53_03835 [Myxococcota bacterium]|nr:hypothetical protein [Myxococcota bacterium]
MTRARTVGEAAFGPFLTFDRNIWERDDRFPFDQVYVDRGELGAPGGAGARPYRSLLRRLTRVQGYSRALLTGQIGSGKSMELRKLTEEPDIARGFEVVAFSVTDRLNVGARVDIRYLMLAIASVLAEHMVRNQVGPKARRWGFASSEEGVLAEWLGVLPVPPVQAPVREVSDASSWKLSAGLFEKNLQLRTDEEVRAAVLRDDAFSVSKLRRLVEFLLHHTEKAAERPVLLIVDDGDKLTSPESAIPIFVEQLGSLLELPASLVLTCPYWLHFDPRFAPMTRRIEPVLTQNVKVVTREQPDVVLQGAHAFFRQVYDRLVAPDADLVTPDALTLAIRTCAGVPREFLRILQKGFDLADELGQARLDAVTLKLALAELARGLSGFTQRLDTRRALIRIRLTKKLDLDPDWSLLNGLLVVELSNDRPWYDVNPLLQGDVDRWIEDALRPMRGDDPQAGEAELRRRLVEGLQADG